MRKANHPNDSRKSKPILFCTASQHTCINYFGILSAIFRCVFSSRLPPLKNKEQFVFFFSFFFIPDKQIFKYQALTAERFYLKENENWLLSIVIWTIPHWSKFHWKMIGQLLDNVPYAWQHSNLIQFHSIPFDWYFFVLFCFLCPLRRSITNNHPKKKFF